MESLLQALAFDPGRRRRRAAAIALGALAVIVAAGAFPFALYLSDRACQGSRERLGGHWDAERRDALHQAFQASRDPKAEAAWQAFSGGIDRWTAGWVQMRTEACVATKVRAEQSGEMLDLRMECLDDRLRSLDGLLEAFSRSDSTALSHASSAADQLPSLADCANVRALRQVVRPPADPAIRQRIEAVQKTVARARGELFAGRYAAGLPIAQGAVASAEELGYRPLEAEALLMLGTLQFELDDHRTAEETLHRAALAAEIGGRLELAADAYSRLIPLVGFADQKPDDAVRWGEHAAADIERMGGSDSLDGQRQQMLGAMLIRAGRTEEARQAFAAALPLYEKAYGPEHPRVAHVLEGLSVTLIRLGRDAEALPLLERAQAIFNRVLGPEHPYAARGLLNMGNALRHLGQREEARERITQAIQILAAAHAEESETGGAAHHDLGDVWLDLGQVENARSEYLRGQAIDLKIWGTHHAQLAPSYEGLGAADLKEGKASHAVPLLERAVELLENNPSNPEELAETRVQLARAVSASNPPRAAQLATAARPVLERSVNPRIRAEAPELEALIHPELAESPKPAGRR
jgi:tetratricopeptide (TPR) repeat protein